MISVGFSSHAAETPGNQTQVKDYLAILDLEIVGNIDQSITRPLSDCIRRDVVGFGKFRVMERRRMDKILQEQDFRMTGCVERQCAPHGNVSEWCQDWYGTYPSYSVSDPTGPPAGGHYRVIRGGSYKDSPAELRSSSRDR
jgi:hypothetical protein